jgi:hypothetical protein
MIRQDDEGIKTFISKLGTDYPLGTADVYAQLVYKLQVVKKDELAQAMLAATTALDPTTPQALQALINQANGQTAPTPAPAPTSAATGTAPVATATYNGLRR